MPRAKLPGAQLSVELNMVSSYFVHCTATIWCCTINAMYEIAVLCLKCSEGCAARSTQNKIFLFFGIAYDDAALSVARCVRMHSQSLYYTIVQCTELQPL